MDMEYEPCTIEEAYLRIYSTRTRDKYFPQFFKTDYNGDSKLQVPSKTSIEPPKFQEPELRDSTTPYKHPDIRIYPETPTTSKSHMTLNTPNFNSHVHIKSSKTDRPTTAPDTSSSTSNTRVKVLSRTVTKILVPRSIHNANTDIIIDALSNMVINQKPILLPPEVQQSQDPIAQANSSGSIQKVSSKKSVGFKTQLVQDPPIRSSDPSLPGEENNSATKGVLKAKSNSALPPQTVVSPTDSIVTQNAQQPMSAQKRMVSRIPIPILRARAPIKSYENRQAVASTASIAPKIGVNNTRKVMMRSPPILTGRGNVKKPSKSASSSEKTLEKGLNPILPSSSESFDNSQQQSESIQLTKTGSGKFPLGFPSDLSDKGLLDETRPQLYNSDTSISSTTRDDNIDNKDKESNSRGESSSPKTPVLNIDKDSYLPVATTSSSLPHQHNLTKSPPEVHTGASSDAAIGRQKNPQIIHPSGCSGISSSSTSDLEWSGGGEVKAKKSGIIPCRYRTAGCSEEVPRGTLAEEEHYQHCRYRPIPCLFNRTCNEIVPYHNFILHHNTHSLHPIYTSNLLTPVVIHQGDFLTDETFIPKWLSTFDNHFFLMLNHNAHGRAGSHGTWLCWLWMLGSPEEARDYSYEVEVSKGPRRILGTFTAQSVHTSADEVERTKSGLLFTDNAARTISGIAKSILGEFLIDVNISKKPDTHREKPSYTGSYKEIKEAKKPAF